ncbi:MAG: helix-turn-helix domain-containing protein [Hydrogeniiclostridium mannosilyticum]
MGYFDSIYTADLPHRAVTVYMYLKNRTSGDGACRPAIPTIASDLRLSESTVRRALADLTRGGWLEKSPSIPGEREQLLQLLPDFIARPAAEKSAPAAKGVLYPSADTRRVSW